MSRSQWTTPPSSEVGAFSENEGGLHSCVAEACQYHRYHAVWHKIFSVPRSSLAILMHGVLLFEEDGCYMEGIVL